VNHFIHGKHVDENRVESTRLNKIARTKQAQRSEAGDAPAQHPT